MRLIIAEKRSVGQAIADAIGGHIEHGNGCLTLPDTVVTWAQGHLVELAEPGEYEDRSWGKWSMDGLPIDPDPDWQWTISRSKGAAEQYRTVARLIADPRVDLLVNACDPDREGEAIFRRITRHAHARKPMMRLWAASLEPDAIRQALETMSPEREYDGLAAAADIRAKADWLVGMNASRAYTLTYDRRLPVGRVQTPTLALVTDRDQAIAEHRKTPYWKVVADMGGWRLASERIGDQETAGRLARSVTDGVMHVTETGRSRARQKPPHLYDLTGLQKDMARMHGITAARTLAALQRLYELKLASYPRTDSRYITHDDLETLHELTQGTGLVDGFIDPAARPAEPRYALVVDDSKVAGHTAILPTRALNSRELDRLDDDQRKVITRIVRRMWEAIGQDRVHDVTKITATHDGHTFTSRSDQTIEPGWTRIEPATDTRGTGDAGDGDDDADQQGNVIPVNLTEGIDLHPIHPAQVVQGETKPPARFTDATLLAAMEHASRYVQDRELKHALDDDESHSGGIGTPATRADIIEKLIKSGYLERHGRHLESTQTGRLLVRIVSPELKDIALTARMEQALSDVEHGSADPDRVMGTFRELAHHIPEQAAHDADPTIMAGQTSRRKEYGPCPRCGQPVVRTGHVWQCSTNKNEKQPDGGWKQVRGCGWKLFGTISGRKLTDANVRTLLNKGGIRLKGFTSKNGKTFDATLVPDPEHGCRFDFNDHGRNRK